ncbi:SIW14 [Candida oxycetoniae]|uniref:diphosphoinositol-polyphosphate diphosphatase n=1 Tax=Candida oxycetoniae TaxID=497107 RepID=A0AAI9WZ71_9ASCO|nr:SIW14 [Candida oxycetoniae]KAI3406067.2 SIW14 [Candida oxycetoniae]
MVETPDAPFQMDDDFPAPPNLPTLSKDTSETSITLENYSIQSRHDSIFEADKGDDIDNYNNNRSIRSTLDQLKIEEKGNTREEERGYTIKEEKGYTGEEERGYTEEEERGYNEDADDNLDITLQKQLQEDFEKKHGLCDAKQVGSSASAAAASDKVGPSLQKIQFNFDVDDEPLTPPENFALVIRSIYRSSFPQPANFSFLKTLKLKSILCLIPEEYPVLQEQFLASQGIKLFQLGMSGNKEPFVKISSELITQAIKIVLNSENQPILVHCNRGKHRTGCLVGVLRRLQNWSKTIIFDEYRKFAAPKERPMDQQFIELYDDEEIKDYCDKRGLLPLKWG